MTCQEFIDFLNDYLGGELPAGQAEAFDRHVGGCPDCAAYLQNYEASVRLGRAAFHRPEEELAPQVPERLVEAVLALRPPRP